MRAAEWLADGNNQRAAAAPERIRAATAREVERLLTMVGTGLGCRPGEDADEGKAAGCRILVVDDDPTARRLSSELMELSGYQVIEAADGEEALALFAEIHPDLVLLDALMPGMDGFAVCSRMRSVGEAVPTPIIMVTALDDRGSVDYAFQMGASDFVTKPIHLATLRHRVHGLIHAARIERALLRAKNEWEATFDAVSDLLILTDPDGMIVRYNGATARRFGPAMPDLVGKSIAETLLAGSGVVPPAGGLRATHQQVALSGGWFHVSSDPVRFEDGRDGVVWTLSDITATQQAQDALRESEAKLRVLMETVASAVLIAQDGVIRYANPAAEAITGCSRHDLGGMCFWDLFDAESRELLRARDGACEPGDALLYRCEARVVTRGGERWVDLTIQRIEYEGRPALLGTALDITERRQFEARVATAQRMAGLGNLAAGVAHEINSPLQVITGVSEGILSRLDHYAANRERLERSISTIHRNAWRCAEIVRSLSAYAQMSSQRFELHDLNDLVRDTLLLTEHQLRSWSHISVQTELTEGMPPLLCERNQIIQALVNLLTNARDAMRNGGVVAIRTRYDGKERRFALEVDDEGPGIPESVRAQVFEPFFTTKPPGMGTGMGLSIVAGIVQTHNGEIQIASKPGHGAAVTLVFPEAAGGWDRLAGRAPSGDRFGRMAARTDPAQAAALPARDAELPGETDIARPDLSEGASPRLS